MRTHLPYKLLDSLIDSIFAEIEFRGHPLCLLSQGHAALRFGVEGTDEVDVDALYWLGTDGRFGVLKHDRITKGDARGRVLGQEAQDGEREVRCKEVDAKCE